MKNHLIESASPTTGSMIIWDTGEYSILPYYEHEKTQTDHSLSDASVSSVDNSISDSDKLRQEFQKVSRYRNPRGLKLRQIRVLNSSSAKFD